MLTSFERGLSSIFDQTHVILSIENWTQLLRQLLSGPLKVFPSEKFRRICTALSIEQHRMSVGAAHIINILLKCQMLIRNYSACNAGILIKSNTVIRFILHHEICEMWSMADVSALLSQRWYWMIWWLLNFSFLIRISHTFKNNNGQHSVINTSNEINTFGRPIINILILYCMRIFSFTMLCNQRSSFNNEK